MMRQGRGWAVAVVPVRSHHGRWPSVASLRARGHRGLGVLGPAVRLAGPAPSLPTGSSVVGPSDASARSPSTWPSTPATRQPLPPSCTRCPLPARRSTTTTWPPAQFASTFGPTPATIASTRSWLTSAGLQPGTPSPDGLLVPVSGPRPSWSRPSTSPRSSARLADGRVARFTPHGPRCPPPWPPRWSVWSGCRRWRRPSPSWCPARPRGLAPLREPSAPGRARRRSCPRRARGTCLGGRAAPRATRPASWPRPTASPASTATVSTGTGVDHRGLRARAVHAGRHRHLRELLRASRPR